MAVAATAGAVEIIIIFNLLCSHITKGMKRKFLPSKRTSQVFVVEGMKKKEEEERNRMDNGRLGKIVGMETGIDPPIKRHENYP